MMDLPPAAYADRPLFGPLAGLLPRFTDALPTADQLTALLGQITPKACSGSGQPIRFIPPPADLPAYEQHIDATGEVPTRADDWHDFFNALAWCVWPQTKSACNALHLREQQARAAAGLTGRGPVRDALTQFDECGVAGRRQRCGNPGICWLRTSGRRRLVTQHRCAPCGQQPDSSSSAMPAGIPVAGSPSTGLCSQGRSTAQVDEAWLALCRPTQQPGRRRCLAGPAPHLVPQHRFDATGAAPAEAFALAGYPGRDAR